MFRPRPHIDPARSLHPSYYLLPAVLLGIHDAYRLPTADNVRYTLNRPTYAHSHAASPSADLKNRGIHFTTVITPLKIFVYGQLEVGFQCVLR